MLFNGLLIAYLCCTMLFNKRIYWWWRLLFKRAYLLRLFPISFLWLGAGLFSGTLSLYLYRTYEKSAFMNAYLAIQVLLWLLLGYFFKKVYISAYQDELTNLWNRKYLYIRLKGEIKRLRHNTILSLAIVDIDDFKSVNDTFGHLFGDKVLKEIADILKNNLRKDDIIARWGGEEFIIVLPNTEVKSAKVVFNRIREKIEKYDFGCKITVSGGIAFVNEYIESEKLIEMADKALYKAKKRKNRIAIYEKY